MLGRRLCLFLLLLLTTLEIIVFQQLIFSLTADIVHLQDIQNIQDPQRSTRISVKTSKTSEDDKFPSEPRNEDDIQISHITALTTFILTLLSAANLSISLLHGCGITCLRPGTPSCAGVVFFQLLIKWWTVLKVVFALGLSVLIFTKDVPVPVLGTATFAVLLVIFSVYEVVHILTQTNLVGRIVKKSENKDDILYRPVQSEEF
ncbi:uncharacterized protein LOC111696734 isoform X2 [Eurytemora carolleeae]|nr:uncharacterized protein LOC111696734 isoform X2 [Eurytemora carolleeae]|eukprot:XP_023322219.1 uncharacterized protein LOC111696734 isoform X2 [Eurytemora affinis]